MNPRPITAYIIQHCVVCKNAAVRVPVNATMSRPICKWCEAKEGRDEL
jgi:hypothetical protein